MGTVTRTAEGNLASFRTCLKRPLESLKVTFGPVQAGSGDPSPANVRPISGWTGVMAERCGKNLMDLSKASFGYIKGTGELSPAYRNNRVSDYFKVIPDSQVTCSLDYCTDAGAGPQIAFYSAKDSGSLIKRVSYNDKAYSRTFIVPSNARYARAWFSAGSVSDIPSEQWFDENVHCQIEIGNSTAYEAYNGTSYSISWQSEAGTVYGGYVDLVTGELVATHKKATFDGSSDFTVQSSSLYVIWKDIPDMAIGSFYGDSYSLCDKCAKVSARSTSYPGHLEILIGYNNRTVYMYYLNEYAGTTGASATVRAWLNENPITVTYPLANHIHYQLTPQQIETLIGRNNIWSEQGPVYVQYLDKDTKNLLWAQRRAMMSAIPKIDRSLIYRLPQPTVFNGTAEEPINSGVALLPTNRAMTVEIDLTPGTFTARKIAFYAGMYVSPYYWVGLEFKNSAWAVSSYDAKIPLTNLSAGKRCRVVIRKEADSNEIEAFCYDGETLVSGSITDSRITSDNPMIVGGY